MLSVALVGCGDDRHLEHTGDGQHHVFDLGRADVLTAADDDVLLAVGDREVSPFVEDTDVPGGEPSVAVDAGRGQHRVDVADEAFGPAAQDLPRCPAQEVAPVVAEVARADRAFLGKVVHHLAADLGIRQFLDIGTGLPTASNTHEVAQRAAPESRIVYVDNDPIVLAHARALLTGGPQGATAYIDADARDTEKILAGAADTLDFSQPVAVLLLGILLFIPDEDGPYAITSRLMGAVPPGSYLAISHGASDIEAESVAKASGRYNQHSAVPMHLRTRAEFIRFFDGLDIADPGVVPLDQWEPGTGATGTGTGLPVYGALGRKPG